MFRASTLLYPDSGDIFLQSTTLPDVTQLLAEWRTADDTAIDKLIPWYTANSTVWPGHTCGTSRPGMLLTGRHRDDALTTWSRSEIELS